MRGPVWCSPRGSATPTTSTRGRWRWCCRPSACDVVLGGPSAPEAPAAQPIDTPRGAGRANQHASTAFPRLRIIEDKYQGYLLLHGLSVETAETLAQLWHRRIREEWG